MKTLKLTRLSSVEYSYNDHRNSIKISLQDDSLYGGDKMWFATMYQKDSNGEIVDQKNCIDPTFYLSTMRGAILDYLNNKDNE